MASGFDQEPLDDLPLEPDRLQPVRGLHEPPESLESRRVHAVEDVLIRQRTPPVCGGSGEMMSDGSGAEPP